jgi:tetratricopeptide (TPR) repeat protein
VQHDTPPAPLFSTQGAERLFWLLAVLILLVAVALNLRVLDFGFLYLRDDDVNVTVNPNMGGLSVARLAWMFTDWSYVRRYIPLGWLNFSATYEFGGLDPAAYHAVGLFLYGANSLLVLAVTANVIRIFVPARSAGLGTWDVAAAALATAWWTFHPFRVETTAWVSGNLYGQAALLLLGSLLAYLRSYGAAGRRRGALIVLSCLLYTASLLTYPVALGVPVLLVGLDWLYTRSHAQVPFRRLLAEKAAFLVPLAGVLAVTVAARFAGAGTFGVVPGLRDLSLADRVAQSAYVAAYYVWKPWWPTHLSPLYDTLMSFSAAQPLFLASIAAVAAVSVYALATFRSRPAVAVTWFGYLACAAPFFGLTEKPHMASDRYGYFLTVIAATVLACLLCRIRPRAARAGACALFLCVVAALGFMTARQLEVWRDDRAQHHYVASLIRNPELLDLFTSRLLILEFMRGNEDYAAQAVAERLKADPTDEGYLKAAGIIEDKRKVASYYGRTSLVAIVQEQTSYAYAKAGEYREADDHLAAALAADPAFFQASYARAGVLLDLGRPRDALASYLDSEHSASPALTRAQRRDFIIRLEHVCDARGDQRLAASARAALSR